MPRIPFSRSRKLSDYAGAVFFLAAVGEAFRVSWDIALISLPILAQNVIISIAFLIRKPEAAASRSVRARAIAYGHGFMIVVFTNLAGRYFPAWYAETPFTPIVAAGVVLYVLGIVLSVRPLYELRHAFSIEPQARELVTSGPYRWARHPIYAAYVIEITGLLLWHMTAAFAVVYIAYLALLWLRIREEEAVLERAFPEYREYRERVGPFGPRSLRRAPRSGPELAPACPSPVA